MSITSTKNNLSISALGVGWPGQIPLLARHLELYGYERFWATEHHALYQSASPLVVAAVVLAVTHRLAVGTAGVMLRYANPLRIAKDAHLLELMFPGRLDVGTIGGLLGQTTTHRLLSIDSGEPEWATQAYRDVVRYLRLPDLPFADGTPIDICRSHGSVPRLWLCSNRAESAICAGQEGVGFAFHIPQAGAGGMALAMEVIDAYRAAFVANRWMVKPKVAVVCSGICAESTLEARRVWPRYLENSSAEFQLGQISPRVDTAAPDPTFFMGDPEQCRAHILELAEAVAADEVVIHCAGDSFQRSLTGYALLAKAFCLGEMEPSGAVGLGSNRL